VLLAARSLVELGVTGLSIDLSLPTIVPAIFTAYGITGPAEQRLVAALSHRDAATVGAEPGVGPLFKALLDVAGPAGEAIRRLGGLDLPPSAEPDRARLIETVRRIHAAEPKLTLTVDPVERQGFEYQTGLSFTFFARGSRRELGRGGRYRIGSEAGGEPAVGFSLFADAVVAVAPADAAVRRVYIPLDQPQDVVARLQASGWITIGGLAAVADLETEARRLGCGYVLPVGASEPRALSDQT
jgi:ATP phosphoribosyltransferase regulatory subunit